jgi:hypothetical protein
MSGHQSRTNGQQACKLKKPESSIENNQFRDGVNSAISRINFPEKAAPKLAKFIDNKRQNIATKDRLCSGFNPIRGALKRAIIALDPQVFCNENVKIFKTFKLTLCLNWCFCKRANI